MANDEQEAYCQALTDGGTKLVPLSNAGFGYGFDIRAVGTVKVVLSARGHKVIVTRKTKLSGPFDSKAQKFYDEDTEKAKAFLWSSYAGGSLKGLFEYFGISSEEELQVIIAWFEQQGAFMATRRQGKFYIPPKETISPVNNTRVSKRPYNPADDLKAEANERRRFGP